MAVQGPVDNRYNPFLHTHDITVVCVTDLDEAPGMFFFSLLLCDLTCPLSSPRALSAGCAMPRVFTLSFFVFYVSIFFTLCIQLYIAMPWLGMLLPPNTSVSLWKLLVSFFSHFYLKTNEEVVREFSQACLSRSVSQNRDWLTPVPPLSPLGTYYRSPGEEERVCTCRNEKILLNFLSIEEHKYVCDKSLPNVRHLFDFPGYVDIYLKCFFRVSGKPVRTLYQKDSTSTGNPTSCHAMIQLTGQAKAYFYMISTLK